MSADGRPDTFLLVPKALYIALNAMVYSSYAFNALYLADVWHIPQHVFGYTLTLGLCGFPGALLWTAVADRTHRCRAVLVFTALAFFASFVALRLVQSCALGFDLPTRTAIVCVSAALCNFFSSALFPLVDRSVCAILARRGTSALALFGHQRVYGIVAQSATVAALGAAIGKFGYDAIFVFLAFFFVVFAVLVAFAVPAVLGTTNVASWKPAEDPKPDSKAVEPPKQAVSPRLPPVLYAFLAATLVAGVVRGVLGNFLVPFFKTALDLGASATGYVMQARLATEIAMFFAGSRLVSAYGAHAVFQVGALAGVLRAVGYVFVPSVSVTHFSAAVALSAVLETLKGVNNACIISAGVRIAHDLAPHGREAVAQGAFSGMHSYLANAVSGAVGGLVLQIHAGAGARAYVFLFAYTSVAGLLGVFVLSVLSLSPRIDS